MALTFTFSFLVNCPVPSILIPPFCLAPATHPLLRKASASTVAPVSKVSKTERLTT